jgi:small subunit ribosomal protein S6
MPVNSYECLFLLDPTKTASDMEGVKTNLHGIFQKYGAEILASRKWDDRKLAYPIRGQKKGIYHLTFFKADTQTLTDIENDFRINEYILRHLISVIDPKWEAEMLAVAKDEHRLALQVMHDESPEGGAEPGIAGLPVDDAVPNLGDTGEGRPRRGSRRPAEAGVDKD